MNASEKLTVIKLVHTAIWLFFVCAIFYVVYSGIINRITVFTYIAMGLVVLEGLVLLVFKMFCPLTLLARKYTNSTKDNFDIFFTRLVSA